MSESAPSSRALFSGHFGGYLSSRLPCRTTSTLHEDEDFLAFVDVFEDVRRSRGVFTSTCTSTTPRTVLVLVQGARAHARKSDAPLPGTGTCGPLRAQGSCC